MDHNIWDVFSAVSRAVGSRDAIIAGERRFTYAQLAERAMRFGALMHDLGLGAHRPRARLENWESGQDLVGLYLMNGPEYLEACLGAYASRVAPFNVNYHYVADELAGLLDDASAAALVYHGRFAPTLADVLPRLDHQPLLFQVDDGSGNPLLDGARCYEQALAAAATALDGVERSPDDLYVLYTGGTTGTPKGTLWRQADAYVALLGGKPTGTGSDRGTSSDRSTGSDPGTGSGPGTGSDHADDVADVADIAAAASARTPTRLLPNAPFMHGAGQWLALRQLLRGGTVVLNGVVDHFDPVEMWSLIDEARVDVTLFVGEAFARPAMDAYEAGDFDGSSLQLVGVGGAVTSPETKERILRSLPWVTVLDVAGASEVGSALIRVSTAGAVGELGIFAPEPGTAVLDPGRTRPLQPGEDLEGWLATTGRIPLGYLGDATKTRTTFPVIGRRRWSVPGDRARLRADGSVELLGRDSVTINSGGEKIFAEEVEHALMQHPAIADAVVTGRPSRRWGQEVVAIVQLRPGDEPTDEDLLAPAAARIARYKLPKRVIRVARVERSPAGKADYRWARKLAEEPAAEDAGIG